MKKILAGMSLSVAMLMASGGYEVGLGVGVNSVDKAPITDNYNLINARIGKYLPKNHVLRVEYERSEHVNVVNSQERISRLLLNVEHDFGSQDAKAVPYAFIGAGKQWVTGDYDDNMVADLGVGAKFAIKENLKAFMEVRGLRDFGNNDNHYGALLGLVYGFGGEKPAPVVAQPTKPKDSDNDGVVDSLDKCPSTPAGVKVDANGCPVDSDNDGVADYLDKCPSTPAGVKVDVNGCPVDSDHDGVADYLDKCPNTLKDVKVDAKGCPLDSDHDGVADYKDACPNTPSGFSVNAQGCAITYNFEITFDNDSAVIKPEFMKKVEDFANFLKEHKNAKAEIQGYTDNRGSYDYNVVLSERRAKAVYDALLKLGVSKDQITWAGYGPKNPIASNDTAEGRAKNRRVVAKIYY